MNAWIAESKTGRLEMLMRGGNVVVQIQVEGNLAAVEITPETARSLGAALLEAAKNQEKK